MWGFLDQEGWVGHYQVCGGFTQGSEGGFWKPGPSLAVYLCPSGRGQPGDPEPVFRPLGPSPVLVTNKLKRYFCLF